MRILHSEWSDGWGGQERRILLECEGLQARGHYVEIVTRESCWIAKQAEIRGIPVSFIKMRRNFDPAATIQLARHLRKGRFDILNTHSGIDSWIGGLAAKLAGTPVLVRTRHLHIPFWRSPLNFVHYLPDRIFCISESMRHILIEERGFPAKQIINIPTGIDLENFVPTSSRAVVRTKLEVPENHFVVLVVGVIRSVKCQDIALTAFAQMIAAGIKSTLIIAGDGPVRQEMERLAERLNITKHVRFLGQRDDIPDLMQAADVLLLTSRSEAIPQVLNQALSLGLAAVATAVGGVPEVIIHENTGLLVPPNAVDAVVAALLRLIHEPMLAKKFAVAGRRHVIKRYGLLRMLDDTERSYCEVLAEKGLFPSTELGAPTHPVADAVSSACTKGFFR